MIHAQDTKYVSVTPPGAIVDNAAFTTATVDTIGWDYITWIIYLGALDIAVAVMKLREGDASNMSDAADIAGADFSVLPATLPAATDDNKIYGIQVNLAGGGRKRYQDLSLTGADGSVGTYATVLAVLSRAKQSPNTAAKRGFAQELIIV